MNFMKKLLSATLVFVLALTLIPSAALANDIISVTIDGEMVVFADQEPVIVDDRVLVPVGGVFEAIGFEPNWDSITRTATLTSADYVVVITIDSATFTTNGIARTLDVPAQIIGDRTMLPIRAVLESVGYTLTWNGLTRTVIIVSSAPTQPTDEPTDATDEGPTPHPFAVALEYFNDNAEGETKAFLVDVDGNGTEGMLVVDLYGFPTGVLFYIHIGALRQADLGPQDAGFVSSMTTEGRRLINLMGDGGQWSYTLFSIKENGDLEVMLTIFAEGSSATEREENSYYVFHDPIEDAPRDTWIPITSAEYNETITHFGLDNMRGAWWEMDDESATILALRTE